MCRCRSWFCLLVELSLEAEGVFPDKFSDLGCPAEAKFEPEVFKTGEQISLVGSLLVFGFFGFATFMQFRKGKEEKK